jgi:Cytochrome c554 and c-prime
VVHTVLGVGLTAPIAWYCLRHWLTYRRHPLSHVKLQGYFAVLVLLVCAVSGFVLTWDALFAVRTGPLSRGLHRWTTVALAGFALTHVLAVVWRDRRRRRAGDVELAAATRRYGLASTVGTLAPFVVVGAILAIHRAPVQSRDFPPDHELWQPSNPLYGANKPFAPSLARTPDNRPIEAAMLAGSKGCGTAGCHQQIVEEWQPSAHRYAAMDKAFQAIQLTMAKQNGPTSTRYCGGCHDPISLFSGTKNISTTDEDLTGLHGYQEGISCLSCHAVRQTDVRGNAQYTVHPPPRYVGEIEYDATGGSPWRLVRDFLIRAYPQPHVDGLSKVMFKKPEYCAACHKQFVDEEINKVGWVQLQNQFDNWRTSKWARERSDPTKTVECRECHMPLVASSDPAAGDPVDYNRSPVDGRHRSHGFLGANQLMPELMKLEGAAEHTAQTNAWLQGRIGIPEIASKWPGKGVPAVSIELVAPASARSGDRITVRCVIVSNKVGHDFPTGPLDMIQSWVELIARDEAGRVVFSSGTVDERGFIPPGSFMFKAEPVDQYGNLIDRHNLWEMVGVRNRRSLFPGFSDTAEYSWIHRSLDGGGAKPAAMDRQFDLRAPRGRLSIEARLRYRKVDQFLLNYMRSVGFFPEFEGRHLTSPVTDLHEARAVVEVE